MSGSRPFHELAVKVTESPAGRAGVDEYRRIMDAMVNKAGLRDQRRLAPDRRGRSRD